MNYNNLIKGRIIKGNKLLNHISPIDGNVIGTIDILSNHDIELAFSMLAKENKSLDNVIFFNALKELSKLISLNKEKFVEQIVLETGYVLKDSKDLVDGTIELLSYYEKHVKLITREQRNHPFSLDNEKLKRRLQLKDKQFGRIAVVCPQNAPLILEVTAIINALYANNSLVLKPATQVAGINSLLINAIIKSFPKILLDRLSIIICKAPIFLEAAYKHADLIHFIGSSQFTKEILNKGVESNRRILFDGEGASLVIIDKNFDIEKAVKICLEGIIRCNGELCSSIRGIIIHSGIYKKFLNNIQKKLATLEVGDPRRKNVQVGPLFNKQQVIAIEKLDNFRIAKSKTSNYINPHLIVIDNLNREIMKKNEIYGPVAWIVSYANNEWKDIIKNNNYPLNDTLLSKDKKTQQEFVLASNAPRIIINGDPSLESVFEPWGAFLPSGQNDVSYWYNKYLKIIQIDVQKYD